MCKKPEYTTAQFLQNVLREIAGRASEGSAYREHWGDKFACDQVAMAWKDDSGPMREARNRRLTLADFWTLTESEMNSLGFGKWGDSGLQLIPLWAFNYIADGEVLTSISGDTVIKGKDKIDLDVRFGCIAFGFANPQVIQ